MNFSLTGLPALIFLIGFVVVFAAPVWLAARLTGAKHPTLMRAVGALVVGMVVWFLLVVLIGPWGILLAPVGYLMSFKYILGTSFMGSVLLAIVAGLGYVALGYLFSGFVPGIPGIPVGGPGITV
ncbi:MAG TPA: hypothetical protein DIC36_01070 [Gammaproteobacteria bacterium]|nr:hypothetical protein [Gammaproteobacteria bacterium]